MLPMASRRRKTRRPIVQLSSGQRRAAGIALVLVAVAIAIWWSVSQRRNRSRAAELYEASMAMHSCFARVYGGAQSLVDALDLGFASAAPLAECRGPTLRARDIAHDFRHAYWIKDTGSLGILAEQLDDYAALPFGDDATKLTSPALAEQLTTIDVWQRSVPLLACSVAVAESALERNCDSLDRDFAFHEPRVLSEVTGAKPESFAIEIARNAELRLTLETGASTWLLESKDSGVSWKARLVTPGERPRPVFIERTLPEGTLVGRTEGPPPRIFVGRSLDGAVEIAAYTVPNEPKDPWPEPIRSRLSTTTLPTFAPMVEVVAGSGNEKWFPLLGRDATSGHATLLTSSERKLFNIGFDPPKSATLELVTGGCPPSVLARTPKALTLHVPAARSMTAFPIAPPVSFESSAGWKTASAACTTRNYAVAYISKERVVVQNTDGRSWAFGRARVIAQVDENGTPLGVKLVGTELRLLAIVLRQSIVGDLLRAEVLASTDGGVTWE
jgi:hypothetical protein